MYHQPCHIAFHDPPWMFHSFDKYKALHFRCKTINENPYFFEQQENMTQEISHF